MELYPLHHEDETVPLANSFHVEIHISILNKTFDIDGVPLFPLGAFPVSIESWQYGVDGVEVTVFIEKPQSHNESKVGFIARQILGKPKPREVNLKVRFAFAF